jgi:hypothetical protein
LPRFVEREFRRIGLSQLLSSAVWPRPRNLLVHG